MSTPKQYWRLLEPGETWQEGDEYLNNNDYRWVKVSYAGDPVYATYCIGRRRITISSQQWISVKDRLPTKEDGNKRGIVLWHLILADGSRSSRAARWNEERGRHVTHWTTIPDDPEPEKDAGKVFLWLCSEPTSSNERSLKPQSDSDGDEVMSKKQISEETAAEIAVETANVEMIGGDELSVWVWKPGQVSEAREYFVRVSHSWSFSARLNSNCKPDEEAFREWRQSVNSHQDWGAMGDDVAKFAFLAGRKSVATEGGRS